MREVLHNSGFCFFRRIDDSKVELENKFTGLRVVFNEDDGTFVAGKVVVE